jgi:hypothetical protein
MNTNSVCAELLLAIAVIAPLVVFTDDNIRFCARTGHQAPGFPTGVTFSLLDYAEITRSQVVNASGEMATLP